MTDAADTRDGAGSGRSARTVLTLIGIGLFYQKLLTRSAK